MQRVAFLRIHTHIFHLKIYAVQHDDRDFLVVLQIMFTKPLSFTQNVVVYSCCTLVYADGMNEVRIECGVALYWSLAF